MPAWDNFPNRGVLTDRSGTIAASNVSQLVSPAFNFRAYLFIQNPSSASESLFVNFTSPASVGGGTCYELLPGASIEMTMLSFVSIEQVNVAAQTIGHPFICKEY